MYYRDTITEPLHNSYNATGTHIGFGDPKTPELAFTTVAEAAVAAYLMELVGGTTNPITKDLTQRLGHLVNPASVEAEQGALLRFEADEAREIRRTVKEVAEGDGALVYQLEAIPASVIRAAQQLHYGPQALDMGSTKPTAMLPEALDLASAADDLRVAITDIDASVRRQDVSAAPHSSEFAAAHVNELLDSLVHPIAA